MQITTVIFDFGDVLSLPPGASDYERLADLAEIYVPFEEIYWNMRADYDRGNIDGPTYWRRVAKAAGKELTPEQIDRLIAADIAIWMRTNPPMIGWARALKGLSFKTAVLSNMPIELSRYMRQRALWFRDFDYVCFSAEVKLSKPGAAIYHACLNFVRSKPEECLFIDDRPENVEAARALGFHVIQFVSVAELASEVKSLNIPPPAAMRGGTPA